MPLQHAPAQIVRDSVPAVDPAAPRTVRSWEWVCSALVNKERGECSVDILDTVFIQRDQIWSWFYSSSGGIIRKKAQRKLTVANVCQRFGDVSRVYEQNGAAGLVALCWFEEQRRLQLLTAAECQTYLTNCKGNVCLSAFVHPRGEFDPTRYANLEHEYTLHKTGRLQGKLYRLAMGSQRIMSMDNKLNSVVNEIVHAVVSYVERTKKCRVVQCVSYFVMDDYNRVMLWRTENFQTIPAFPTSLNDDASAATVYDGPHAVNERILARAKVDAFKKPDEKLIQAILSSPTPAARRQSLLLQNSASQPTLSSLSTPAPIFDPFSDDLSLSRTASMEPKHRLRSKIDWDQAMEFLPTSSTLSRGRKRTMSAAHLISSQKRGCCGDYCEMDAREWTSKRLASKVISPPIAVEGSPRGGTGEASRRMTGARSSSVISATMAATAFLTAHPDNSADDVFGRKPMSPQRQQMEDAGKLDGLRPHTIPFKLIAQTRAEKQLVDLFVRRYKKGEDGDYLAEAYYGDGEPLGETFPGYYYQEVQVCNNCFAFYTLVEDVRMKALAQVVKRRSKRSGGDERKHGSRPGRPLGLLAVLEDQDDANDSDLDGMIVEATVAAERTWKKVWTHAQSEIAPSISKKDAAELFSFTNPHPAVAMVVSALGIVLLGMIDVAPGDVKRALSQDKLLIQLQQFKLESLTPSRVECAAAHARNPLFSPANIAPISSCAARFCDWILTILQAYTWKNVRSFRKDPETWELLAFLKPELIVSTIPHGTLFESLFRGSILAGSEVSRRSKQNRSTQPPSSTKKSNSATAAARKVIQNQQMARLAAPTGFVEASSSGGSDSVFTCKDNVTQIPYTIAGQAVGGSAKCNLIVFHDFFDTMDSTKVFFRSILAKHVGARALFFNLPGQACTKYAVGASDHERSVFNNAWCAQRVHELLEYLQESTKFITAGLPFHIVGFGNGANIATSFTVQFGRHEAYVEDLQSLVLLNGFARVDAQLAAILHSTVNVFSCFPPTRPDLPVTFFCKYLFSDGYLAKIDVNLALSIYTAVTNPISLDGRIRVCQGALHHVDLASQLPQIRVPLVLVQSVENALVAPTNVDPYLQQRVNIAHSWSHQQQSQNSGLSSDTLTSKTKKQLLQVLGTPGSAFVSWLRAGHELRQEAKHYITELLELVICSREFTSDHGQDRVHETHQNLEPKVLLSTPSKAHSTEKPVQSPQSSHTEDRQIKSPKRVVPTPEPEVNPNKATRIDAESEARDRRAVDVPASRSQETDTGERALQGSRVNAVQYADPVPAINPEIRSPIRASTNAAPPQEHVALAAMPEEYSRNGPSITKNRASELRDDSIVDRGSERPRAFESVELRRPSLPLFETQEIALSATVAAATAIASQLPDRDAEIEAVRARMQAEEKRLLQETEELRERQRRAAEERMEALRLEQDRRRRQWEDEDNARLAALETKLRTEQEARDEERRRRERDLLAADLGILSNADDVLSVGSIALAGEAEVRSPVRESKDLVSPTLHEMKQSIKLQPDLPSVFDQMEAEEKAKKRVGTMRVDEFDDVKKSVTQNFSHHVKEHDSSLRQELLKRKQRHAINIQKHIRRYLAVQRVMKIRQEQQVARMRRYAGGEIVRIVRGFLGRRRFVHYREVCRRRAQEQHAAVMLQCVFRGFVCRIKFRKLLRNKKIVVVQRVYRGHRGRIYCNDLRESQRRRTYLDRNASKVQSTWRMHVARDRFLTHRISILAATEVQRMYRGHLGRIEAKRKKAWRDAEPGPERLALGLKMIEGSKQAFERQQNEIDALHRAQEAVERQVSTIHAELQESEKELAVLERELQEIDQLEADLRELTHEAEMLHNGGLEGILKSTSAAAGGYSEGQKAAQPLGSGVPATMAPGGSGLPGYEIGMEDLFEGKGDMKRRQADAYAVEMAIQIKRAEREKKKKDLEAEFTSVFAEVQQKRQALTDMEEKLADMEATRMRKDREFARMQRNLMELLEEQKLELENLREKGIELEAATATSAAAAAATAMKAKEHEKRSQAMFESTEELMKFQFMSMSLSYFSSLNMLKNLRDINADTTSAAISSTAETAAAAAAAAAAANIPTMKRLQVGGSDLMMAASQLKKNELEQKLKEEEEAKHANQQPMPDEVKDWNVDDVGRWLDSLSLSQYKKAFREGAVDGEFLLELRPEDMSDVLGVSHKLHVRKIIVARNRLLPLSQQEQSQLKAVEHEEQARNARQGGGDSAAGSSPGALDVDTVFSQARNGRLKRLIESVDAGFDINVEDDKGNTLLLIACQNVNLKMVEYLVAKRANVNHKNAQGNTPLHFAMAYDSEGKLGEYLIAHGADDTIENTFGLTAYDGLQPE